MEGNIPSMASAVGKMDDLKKRDDFEKSKSEMLDKMSAVTVPNAENIPEAINPEVHDSKMGLIKLFIQLAKDGNMDYEDVLERIDQVRDNKFISMDDANGLKKELDVAFGKTPEQIHDAKLGLIRIFIKLSKEGQMEYDEVLEHIQRVKDNNFISLEDQTQLTHELDEALGRTPEQIRKSKLGLAELFISLYQKGQMDNDEVVEHINAMLENKSISKVDADSLRLKLEAEKTS